MDCNDDPCLSGDVPQSSTSRIFNKFQKLYDKQLKEADKCSDGLKLKLKIYENWVEDLTEQNEMLVKTVDELECEALKRLNMLETCLNKEIPPGEPGKLTCQIEALCRELEQLKIQLTEKETLIHKLEQRCDQLSIDVDCGQDCDRPCGDYLTKTDFVKDIDSSRGNDSGKGNNCGKLCGDYFPRSGNICNQDRNVQPSVYRDETLVEVLGIKERSLSHLEHLTEELEEKDRVISCLKQQLTQGSADMQYRVRQQVEWFTENVTQQCSVGNCSEEFKKCVTTMLEELKESIECCNLGPSDTAEMSKASIKYVSSLQKSLEKSKRELCQSWDSISQTVNQLNKMELHPLLDQWRKGICKQKSLQVKLQEIVKSIINISSSSNINDGNVCKSVDSLKTLLVKLSKELNSQPCDRSLSDWLKNLQCVVSELVGKIQEVTRVLCDVRCNDGNSQGELVYKLQQIDSLQREINDNLCAETNAYDCLCKKEKAQRIKVDSLLASVLHHQEIWCQQVNVTDDLMKEILRLCSDFNQHPKCDPAQICQPQICQSGICPPEWGERSTYLQNLVSKISSDIRSSLSNIEQRQNQVSHLELDLSSVKIILESAQQEIEDISMTCNTQDAKRKMSIIVVKLKKQISNALTKANNLVNTYTNTKQDFICSSERVFQLQKEYECLEQEVRCQWSKLYKDFKKAIGTDRPCPCPKKTNPYCGVKEPKKICKPGGWLCCPNKEIIESCEDKCTEKAPLNQYGCVENASEKQDKTICSLQNCLKKCQKEKEELCKKIRQLESNDGRARIECEEEIQILKCKIDELQCEVDSCDITSKNYQKTEEILKSVIDDLKQTICDEYKKFLEIQAKNKQLEFQLECCKQKCKEEPVKPKTPCDPKPKVPDPPTKRRPCYPCYPAPKRVEPKPKCSEPELTQAQKEFEKKMHTIQSKIDALKSDIKGCEDKKPSPCSGSIDDSVEACKLNVEKLTLQNTFLELKNAKAKLIFEEKVRVLQKKLDELQCKCKTDEITVNSYLKTEEGLKSIIEDLKEKICNEHKNVIELQSKNRQLQRQLEDCKQSTDPCLPDDPSQPCQKDVDKCARKIRCLELKNTRMKMEYEEELRKLKCKIEELEQQCSIKPSEESSLSKPCTTKGPLQHCLSDVEKLTKNITCLEIKYAKAKIEYEERIKSLQNKIDELQCCLKKCDNSSSKFCKSEAALQIVIANLKDTICKEKRRCCQIEKENIKLCERVRELEDCCNSSTKSNKDSADKMCELKKQVKCWMKKVSELEDQLKCMKEKLCICQQREKELESEICCKERKYKEDLCKKCKEIEELTKLVECMTVTMNESKTELDSTKMKTCEAEMKLKNMCDAYEELKIKEQEKEAQTEKLQVALTQLSNKFVTRRLETGSQCLRQYQEECAKYEALYNTTVCKLRSKELELCSLKQELNGLRRELDQVTMTSSQPKEDDTCPFLMERVQQLSKELQVTRSCQSSYESIIKELRERYSKKEEEVCYLRTQIKQITMQRDSIMSDLDEAQQEINVLRTTICSLESTIKGLENSNGQLPKIKYDSESPPPVHFKANIELQREISTALTNQLRGVKQKLHATKHDYKLLQAAYEELNRKYTLLQRGERDTEVKREPAPLKTEQPGRTETAASKAVRCRPCLAKSSKSVTYIKMPESMGGPRDMEFLSQSKSWHKMESKDMDWKERRWKRKLQEVLRGNADATEPSSSN